MDPMMKLLVLFISLLPSIVCFVVSAILAVKEKDGWGWFLFVGFLLAAVSDNILTFLSQTVQ